MHIYSDQKYIEDKISNIEKIKNILSNIDFSRFLSQIRYSEIKINYQNAL